MTRGKKFGPDFVSLNAVDGSTTGTAIAINDCRSVEWVVEGTGAIGAGTVVIEVASSIDFAGTWIALATINGTAVASGVSAGDSKADPPGSFMRARSAGITVGTVIARLNGLLG